MIDYEDGIGEVRERHHCYALGLRSSSQPKWAEVSQYNEQYLDSREGTLIRCSAQYLIVMREKAGGFTEAEILALAWSKRIKEGDLINAKKQTKTILSEEENRRGRHSRRRDDRHDTAGRKHSRKASGHADSRSSRRSQERRGVKRYGERDSPNYSLGSYEKHVDGEKVVDKRQSPDLKESNDEWERSRSRDRDVRGHRDGDRGKHGDKNPKSRREEVMSRDTTSRRNSRNRSKSRTRSRSPSRSRSISYERGRSKSRSRSRSRSRSPMPPTWSHDMFSSVVTNSPDRKIGQRGGDSDYRPPSPTWVSRAGGVAIMRKKS